MAALRSLLSVAVLDSTVHDGRAPLVRLRPGTPRLREFGSEIQVSPAFGGLLIPARPHPRLTALIEVIECCLTREHAPDVAPVLTAHGYRVARERSTVHGAGELRSAQPVR